MEKLLKYHKDGKMEEVEYLYVVYDGLDVVTIMTDKDRADLLCNAFGFFHRKFHTEALDSYGEFTAFKEHIDAGESRWSLVGRTDAKEQYMSPKIADYVGRDVDYCSPYYFCGQAWAKTFDEAKERGMRMWNARLERGHVPERFFEESNDDSIHADE